MGQANIEASKRVILEGFGEGNADLLDEVCSDDFVDHDTIQGDQDTESVKQRILEDKAAFPDLEFTIEDIFEAGDKVVIRWCGEGTFENEFMGQQPTGERGDPIRGIGIDRFDDDGKIAEAWAQWDVLTFMRQIGLIPKGAEAPAGA
ncbi:MAG: ester cyclase [Actinobacteria bacterium]|nr:MAG: ester cyclase [Actinomycetota bacterium]